MMTAPKENRLRLLVVLGEGGHTKQMLRLVELLGPGYDFHYIINQGDMLSALRLPFPGPTYALRRPRAKRGGRTDSAPRAAWQTFVAMGQAWRVVRRVRPHAVIGAGPSVSVPVSLAGKLHGAKVIHVETASRVHTLSLTGKIMYRVADLFIVQWETLRERYPRAVYAGRLW
jgi:beta-1,4-N-acetylglucosaminyltransferase